MLNETIRPDVLSAFVKLIDLIADPAGVKKLMIDLQKQQESARSATRELIGAKDLVNVLAEFNESKEKLKKQTEEKEAAIKSDRSDLEAEQEELEKEKSQYKSQVKLKEEHFKKTESELIALEIKLKALKSDLDKKEEALKEDVNEVGLIKDEYEAKLSNLKLKLADLSLS